MVIISGPVKIQKHFMDDWEGQSRSRFASFFLAFFTQINVVDRFDAPIRISESERTSLLTESRNGDKVTAPLVDSGPGDYNNVGK